MDFRHRQIYELSKPDGKITNGIFTPSYCRFFEKMLFNKTPFEKMMTFREEDFREDVLNDTNDKRYTRGKKKLGNEV